MFEDLNPLTRVAAFVLALACKRLNEPLPKTRPLTPKWELAVFWIVIEDICINPQR